ncbi:hypothetical protein HOY80DRAFT_1027360 [Tuber brumale]|nr:hypothetical protein HOY80DRAFT_1027360 [Tuber brumale]
MVQKSLPLESENSQLQYPVSVHSQRLHEILAMLKERVEGEERRLARVEFSGAVDVAPLVVEEKVEKKIVVKLPVAVAELVVEAVVVEDVAIVEKAGGSRKVAVVAEGGEGEVSSRKEDWMVVKRRVRERGKKRRKRMEEEERDVVRKRMNVWHLDRVLVDNALLGLRGWVPRGDLQHIGE